MKPAPETLRRTLVDYSLTITLHGRIWAGYLASLAPSSTHRQYYIFEEIKDISLETLCDFVNIGDFAQILGAHINVYANYLGETDSERLRVWHTAFTLGEIPASVDIHD